MRSPDTERLILRPREAAHFLGISKATLWRYVRAGELPAPRRLGPNAVGWRRSDLEAWAESRPPAGAA